MNQKMTEYCSKVESTYDIKMGRHKKCPICKQEGTPVEGNYLVMEHRVETKGVVYHRWSYATGRAVQPGNDSTNIL
jgi:hypothetical protein